MKLNRLFSLLMLILVIPFLLGATSATVAHNPKFTAIDSNGNPYVGAKLYTYAVGTNSPKTTWTDHSKGTANTYPIVLDSRGQADVWIDNTVGAYRFKLVDSNGVTLWTKDYIGTIADVTDAASASAASADADAVQTAADVISTNADVVSTGLDVVSTTADVVSTGADATQTALDVIATAADVVSTTADATQTALDVIATNADVVSTTADVVLADAAKVAAEAAAASLNIATPVASKEGALLLQNAADDGYDLLETQGIAGQVLTSTGANTKPSFQDVSGGDVSAAANLTANTIVVGDDGAKGVKTYPGVSLNVPLGDAAGNDFTVDTSKLVVEGDTGNVGIGTSTPALRLEVVGVNGAPATSGTAQTGNARIQGLANSNVLDIGAFNNDPYYVWLQATGESDLSLTYPIVINPNGGNVGIGTAAPANPLAVNRSADGVIVDFESADTVEGTVSIADDTVSYNAFVGSHYVQLKDGQQELPVGAVVISTGEIIPCEVNMPQESEISILESDAFETVEIDTKIIETDTEGKPVYEEKTEYIAENGKIKSKIVEVPKVNTIKEFITRLKPTVKLNKETGELTKIITEVQSRDVSNKEYFPYIDTTNTQGDKRVYGVWFGKMSDDAKGQSFGQDSKPVYLIAQVGLFKIRVTDTNGKIEIGDFLETSTRPMEAQKQTSTQKEVGTIAKAMVDVDWNAVNIDPVLGYRWKLLPCTF